jgi:hypothetical protein
VGDFDLWIAPDDMRRTPRLRVVLDRTREAVIEAWVHYLESHAAC